MPGQLSLNLMTVGASYRGEASEKSPNPFVPALVFGSLVMLDF